MNKKLSFILIFIMLFFLTFPCFSWGFKKKFEPTLIMTQNDPRLGVSYDEKIPVYEVFKTNQRIYFIIHNPNGFKSNFIKYQIVKQDDKAHVGGYTRIRNITKRISDKYQFIDYFTLSQAGKYYLQVFDITNLHHWLAITSFGVVNE